MQDLRLAFRNLLRRPAFAVIAILTIALGIGANAAVFTVSNAVLLAPLPYDRPEDVVVLNERMTQFASVSVTRYNYDDWRAQAKSFAGMAAFRPTNITVTGAGEPERVPAKMMVVVNESMARRYFPDRDALGQRIKLGTEPSTSDPTMEVVGIVGDMHQSFEAGSNAARQLHPGAAGRPHLAIHCDQPLNTPRR